MVLLIKNKDLLERTLRVAETLRETGIPISTYEIIEALRIYSTAKILSGHEYPLEKVLFAVFAKKDWQEQLVKKALWQDRKSSHRKKDNMEIWEKRERSSQHNTGVKKETTSKTLSWKELEKTSAGMLRRKGIKDSLIFEKLRVAHLVETLEKYMSSKNPAYLDLLETELYSLKTRLNRMGENTPLKNDSYKKVFESLTKLCENPMNPIALLSLSNEFGGEFAIKAMRFSLEAGRRALAERIAYRVLREGGRGREAKNMFHGWENKGSHGKLNTRKTIYNALRGHPENIIYRRRKKSGGIILVIDKSDSMKKYVESVVKVVSSYYDSTSKVILFDEDVEVLKVSPAISRAYFLDKLLSKGFSGYTNVYKALQTAVKELNYGGRKGMVMASDFEQTTGDKPYVSLLQKIAMNRIPLVLYTTSIMVRELQRRIPSGGILYRRL